MSLNYPKGNGAVSEKSSKIKNRIRQTQSILFNDKPIMPQIGNIDKNLLAH